MFDDDHVASYAEHATTYNATTVAVTNISHVGSTQTAHMFLAECAMPSVK